MGTLVVTNAYSYVGPKDFTGDIKSWHVGGEGEPLERTNMRSGAWKEFKLGLKKSTFDMEGFWESGTTDTVDSEIFPALTTTGRVVTTGPDEVEGGPAWIHRGMLPHYELLGGVGEMAPFKVNGCGTDGPTGLVRGALTLKKTTVTTTGAKGTALNLGLVAAGQYLYATLHLFGTAGTSITCQVESDDANTFLSATQRITFGGAQTATAGLWGTRVAGAIASDTWFRLNVTAITGTWSVACAIGIGL